MGNAIIRMENNLREIFIIPPNIDPLFWLGHMSDNEFSVGISEFLEVRHESKKKECEERPKDFALYGKKQ